MADTRTFVAAPLELEAITTLQDLTARLRRAEWGGAFRWSAPDTWHLTIKFIGEVPDERMDRLVRALRTATLTVGPLTCALRGLGCFPNATRPNVLWVGVEEPAGRLAELARCVDAALAREGWPAETRPFRPHLTIGRARAGIAHEQVSALSADLLRGSDQTIAKVPVERIIVYGSVLTPAGPRHTALATCPLGQT